MRLAWALVPLLLMPSAIAAPQGDCADPLGATYCTEADVPDPGLDCWADGDTWTCAATTAFTFSGSGPTLGAAYLENAYLSINACTGFSCQETRQPFSAACTWTLEGGCTADAFAALTTQGSLNGRCMEFFAEVAVTHAAGPLQGIGLAGLRQGANTETISLGC